MQFLVNQPIGYMGVLKNNQSNPVAKVAEVLGTAYAGYKGLGYLLRSPISALLNNANSTLSNQNNQSNPTPSNNGW